MDPQRKSGAVTLATLPDGSSIEARFAWTLEEQGAGWSDAWVDRWTLWRNGTELKASHADSGEPAEIPLNGWDKGDKQPLEATPNDDGTFRVSYYNYWAHHLGSVSGTVTLDIDIATHTVRYSDDFTVDLD